MYLKGNKRGYYTHYSDYPTYNKVIKPTNVEFKPINNKINKMKVKYINSRQGLTNGKVYDVESVTNDFGTNWYEVQDDSGIVRPFDMSRFETIDNKPKEITIGSQVRITGNTNGSVNAIGDIGIVQDIINKDYPDYSRLYIVNVPGKPNYSNRTKYNECELLDNDYVPPPKPTDEEFLKSIKIDYSGNGNFIIERLNVFNTLSRDCSLLSLTGSTNFSCGIKQLVNINDLFNIDKFKRYFIEYEHLLTNKLHLELILKGLTAIFDNYKIGLLLMSTNINNNDDFEVISKVIESFDYVTWCDTYNPNSKNNIRMWTINLHKYQNN